MANHPSRKTRLDDAIEIANAVSGLGVESVFDAGAIHRIEAALLVLDTALRQAPAGRVNMTDLERALLGALENLLNEARANRAYAYTKGWRWPNERVNMTSAAELHAAQAIARAYASSPPSPDADRDSNPALLEAARCFMVAWEAGDLAAAVRDFSRAIETAEAAPAEAEESPTHTQERHT
jgi:hypothetical protein